MVSVVDDAGPNAVENRCDTRQINPGTRFGRYASAGIIR
ncbi:hypothetical protein D3OALGA1CA_2319 [Olavius algarvensis associated proteobacterium Delta 3]|nr:hypothetical protein D3OALGB2SA_221 [Olavius algarvensis associated proteobacterium Delta 3]CAB5116861.1 hypothetical protein D3OALGA1CA_2319 [Olavius algarvensis associated proteobacterium Delta 3]